jgi:hypothetical protein
MPLWWNRLLVRLGLRRKPKVWYGAKARVYLNDADGVPRLIGIFHNVSYGPSFDPKTVHMLATQPEHGYIAGRQGFTQQHECDGSACHICHPLPGEAAVRTRTPEEAALFRERHCEVCLEAPSPCCGKLRNTRHAEWCTHVCTHSYQRFSP